MKKYVAIDTETTGLNPYAPHVHPILASSADSEGVKKVYRPEHDGGFGADLARYMRDPNWIKLFYNAKFDLSMLAKVGLRCRGPRIDVALMARMVEPDNQKLTLKYLARKYFDDPYTEEVALRKWIKDNKHDTKQRGYYGIPDHILHPYAIKDAQRTLDLYFNLKPRIDQYGNAQTLKMEMKLIPIVTAMEARGLKVSIDRCKHLLSIAEQEMEELLDNLRDAAKDRNFNPNSTKQVAEVLYRKKTPTRRSLKTGEPSTDSLSLLSVGTPFAAAMLRWRKISKTVGTYLRNVLKAVDANGVLHVSFNQGGARTGRFSSSGYDVKGQLQNIPRGDSDDLTNQIRDVFVPRSGYVFGLIDYNQVEMRLFAHFADDERLLHAIRNGDDLHTVTCERVFGRRSGDAEFDKFRYIAKTLNFAVIYGTGPSTFVDTIYKGTNGRTRITLDEASSYLEAYRRAHPQLDRLFEKCERSVYLTGGIRNAYGRFVPVPSNQVYASVNYLIQGTAADLIKYKMLKIAPMLDDPQSLNPGSDVYMVMQVHDELVFEFPIKGGRPKLYAIAEAMEERTKFKVPLTVSASIGKSWKRKKDLNLPWQGC